MIPTRIGQKSPGGRFAGIIQVNTSVYAVISAPKDTEITNIPFSNPGVLPRGYSMNDGLENTQLMDDLKHPIAQYCLQLEAHGCDDYYLPSCHELELCYRSFKPTAECNNTRYSVTAGNPNSIPRGNVYTQTTPAMTIVACYANSEKFHSGMYYYWSSTGYRSIYLGKIVQAFNDGEQDANHECYDKHIARPVRRILIVS